MDSIDFSYGCNWYHRLKSLSFHLSSKWSRTTSWNNISESWTNSELCNKSLQILPTKKYWECLQKGYIYVFPTCWLGMKCSFFCLPLFFFSLLNIIDVYLSIKFIRRSFELSFSVFDIIIIMICLVYRLRLFCSQVDFAIKKQHQSLFVCFIVIFNGYVGLIFLFSYQLNYFFVSNYWHIVAHFSLSSITQRSVYVSANFYIAWVCRTPYRCCCCNMKLHNIWIVLQFRWHRWKESIFYRIFPRQYTFSIDEKRNFMTVYRARLMIFYWWYENFFSSGVSISIDVQLWRCDTLFGYVRFETVFQTVVKSMMRINIHASFQFYNAVLGNQSISHSKFLTWLIWTFFSSLFPILIDFDEWYSCDFLIVYQKTLRFIYFLHLVIWWKLSFVIAMNSVSNRSY